MGTWGDLVTEIRDVLQDASGRHWLAAELIRYANRIINDIAKRSGHRRRAMAFDVVAGQATYSYADDIGLSDVMAILPDTVTWSDGTTSKRLEYLTVGDLPDDWETQTASQPTGYLLNINGYAGITLYPKPTSAEVALAEGEGYTFDDDEGIVLDIEGVDDTEFDTEFGALIDMALHLGGIKARYKSSAGTAITGDSSVPDIPMGYEDALKFGVLWRAYTKRGPIYSPKMADYYMGLYLEQVAEVEAAATSDMQSPTDRPAKMYWS